MNVLNQGSAGNATNAADGHAQGAARCASQSRTSSAAGARGGGGGRSVQDPILARQYREAIKRTPQRGSVDRKKRVSRARDSTDAHQPAEDGLRAERLDERESKKEDWVDEADDDDVPSISQATYLSSCQTLGIRVTNCILRELAETRLSIKYHHLGAPGLRAAAIALVNNTVVQHVDFTSNDGGPRGAVYIADLLKENLYITDLSFAENGIGSVGVQAICEAVKDNRTLQGLSLAGNRLGEPDAGHFIKLFDSNTTLKRLDLSGNKFGSGGGVILASVIGRCDNLLELDLSWNNLRHRGATAILVALTVNDSITKVDLSYNGFADAGASLGGLLAENTALTSLDLTSNRICDNCVTFIADGLKKNVALKTFLVGKNPYRPDSAMKILQAVHDVEPTSEMRDLDLSDQSVELEFLDLLQKVRDKRQLFMTHGTVIKAPLVDEVVAPPVDVENSDPMMVLMECITQKRLRISDLFTKLDKDENQSLTKQEFIRGLQSLSIPMNAKSIDALIKKLDVNGNGEIDFIELMEGHKEYKKKLSLLTDPVATRETKEMSKLKGVVSKLMKMQKMAEISSVLQPVDTIKLLHSRKAEGKGEAEERQFVDRDAEDIERATKIAIMTIKHMSALTASSKTKPPAASE